MYMPKNPLSDMKIQEIMRSIFDFWTNSKIGPQGQFALEPNVYILFCFVCERTNSI